VIKELPQRFSNIPNTENDFTDRCTDFSILAITQKLSSTPAVIMVHVSDICLSIEWPFLGKVFSTLPWLLVTLSVFLDVGRLAIYDLF
jgi:hypothetical protein